MINRVNGSAQIVTPSSPALLTGDFHPEVNRELDFAALWRAVVRRRNLALAIFAIFVGFVLVFTLLQPRTYTTQTKMIVGSANYDGTNAAPERTPRCPS
jgi:uncharacterized protein involved in exopolysaccharide biosynthesis